MNKFKFLSLSAIFAATAVFFACSDDNKADEEFKACDMKATTGTCFLYSQDISKSCPIGTPANKCPDGADLFCTVEAGDFSYTAYWYGEMYAGMSCEALGGSPPSGPGSNRACFAESPDGLSSICTLYDQNIGSAIISADCANEGGELRSQCPSGAVLTCHLEENGISANISYYGADFVGLTCADFED